MRSAQISLYALVERIFEDGVVSPTERAELVELYRQSGFTVGEVKDVFSAFVHATWGDIISDGVVTLAERKKLIAIVRALRLPPECIPADVARALASLAA